MSEIGIPSKMQWRVREIKKVLKQSVKLIPTSGVNTLNAGQKIIVDLPPNSLVDLSTFLMSYTGWTDHNGNAVGSPAGYVRGRFFPRNSASIIQNLEVKINGKSIVNIPEYNYIFQILYDYTQGGDGLTRRCIGENADPSSKYFVENGVIIPRRGYPIASISAGNITGDQNDKDTYVIRSWLSLLGGNASTSIIDTSMLGQVTIELTLAPSAITALGASAVGAITAVITANSEVGIAIAAATTVNGGAGRLATPYQGNSYHLSDVSFSIVHYDMPEEYYNSITNVLESRASYKLYFPNYSVFTGSPVNSASKSTTVCMTVSTRSFDYWHFPFCKL